MKEKIKICGICQKEIKLSKDDYVHLIDYHLGKFFAEGFYHTRCYNDKIKGGEDVSKMRRQAFQLLKKAREIYGMEEEPRVVNV